MLAMDEQKSHPIGGIDYPRTLQEFDKWFAIEDRAVSEFMSQKLD